MDVDDDDDDETCCCCTTCRQPPNQPTTDVCSVPLKRIKKISTYLYRMAISPKLALLYTASSLFLLLLCFVASLLSIVAHLVALVRRGKALA
jgi:hypothetical protein